MVLTDDDDNMVLSPQASIDNAEVLNDIEPWSCLLITTTVLCPHSRAEFAEETSLVQVITFLVRTIRSTPSSAGDTSEETNWTSGEDDSLDNAFGDSEQLLSRAMSQSHPGT